MSKVLQVTGIFLALIIYVYALSTPDTEYVEFECPEKDGHYPDPEYCDSYFVCKEGHPAQSETCPNGLVYNASLSPESMEYPCVYLKFTDCGSRALPTPNNKTSECSFDYEIKGVGYPNECNKYRSCANGAPTEMSCPENLAYCPKKDACEWSDLVEECDVHEFTGFKCPEKAKNGDYFASKANCSHYFICYNGRPRWMICAKGRYFDPCRSDCVKPKDLKCGPCKNMKVEE